MLSDDDLDHPSARSPLAPGRVSPPTPQRADGLLSSSRARLVLVAFLASFVLAFAWTAERWSAGGALVVILVGFLAIVGLLPKEDE